jgi:cytochrome d ubiquinol oxidase subunit I
VPPWDRPPVNVVRLSFQTMVGIGTMLAILGILTVVVRVRRGRLPTQRAYYAAVAAAGPLSVVALVAGWSRPRSAASPGSSTE